MEWPEAREYCRTHYSDLASIHDVVMNDLVVQECSKTRDHPHSQSNFHYCWIGLHGASTEGTFAWSDGSDTTYTNWMSGKPDGSGSGEDYVAIFDRCSLHGGQPGEWFDRDLIMANGILDSEWKDFAIGFVCQLEVTGGLIIIILIVHSIVGIN
jgi:hypothetical protein